MKKVFGAAIVLAVAVSLFFLSDPYTQAVLAYRASPSAEEALALGQMHFSSHQGRLYDVDKAEWYLKQAYDLNPELPYVHHELGRIAFLRGDFDTALAYLDTEIELHGESLPNTFYVRGLIQGFRGDYDAAALDYAVYLKHDPNNWAAINDYAWVLLKSKKHDEALEQLKRGLLFFPNNPWLLNSASIAYYELGKYESAYTSAVRAAYFAGMVTVQDWLTAYPGNDPRVAKRGVEELRNSIQGNMHMSERALTIGAI